MVKYQYVFRALQDCSEHFKVYKHGVFELDSTAWGFMLLYALRSWLSFSL